MTPLLSVPGADVYHSSHLELASLLAEQQEAVDAVIVDAPYSAKTHEGTDAAERDVRRSGIEAWGGRASIIGRPLPYAKWSASDVSDFVAAWAPVCRGWFVSLTDDVLMPVWKEALADAGMTTFQDVPAIITGMTVRLAGDGPSSWAIHCVVARPKRLHKWGTLPGAYVLPASRNAIVGGKPLELMRALVRDYSRPGDLVCDPCMGAGTTLSAARIEGRRAIGCDIDLAHANLAATALSGRGGGDGKQPSLFTEAT